LNRPFSAILSRETEIQQVKEKEAVTPNSLRRNDKHNNGYFFGVEGSFGDEFRFLFAAFF